MLGYIIKRLLLVIPVLVLATLLVFFLIRLIPGDPAVLMAGDLASEGLVRQIREELGLDRPLPVQYVFFMRNLLQGDLGRSTRVNRPVRPLVMTRFFNTMQLSIAALGIALLIGIPTGIISATKRNSIWDGLSTLLALVGVSLPAFWLGLMLMLLFSVRLRWFPVAGKDSLLHLVLPALTLGLIYVARISRITRSSMLDTLPKKFISTARGKGLREIVVICKHALKNALIPIVTITGLQFGHMLGGAVLTETVFAWPGMGRLLVDSLLARDYPVFQGVILLYILVFIFVNLVVDLLYNALDPRIRY